MVSIPLSEVDFIGAGLSRPETVLTTKSGDLFVPDKRGGISVIRPNGSVETIIGRNRPDDFLPNGFAILPDRSFLIANLGRDGGVWHLTPDGELTPRIMEVDGERLLPTNFVGIDREQRIWITVSTRKFPRDQSFRKGVADGYIAVADSQGARIVAEGLGFTNEAIVDPSGRWLYVNETIARRTSRFEIRSDGSLGPRKTFAQYGAGTFPDGFAFDVEGGVWIVSVGSNRVIRATPDGHQEIVLEDADPAHVERIEAAFQDGSFGRAEIDSGRDRPLANLSGIGFGGEDLRTVYLGSLFGERIAYFRSPIPGAEPVHWNY